MVEKVFKKVVIVDKKKKGKGVIIDEVCLKGDFVIEYVGKKVSHQELVKNGGHGTYYMKFGLDVIQLKILLIHLV